MFEDCPQRKIAISYNVKKKSGLKLYIACVFSVVSGQINQIMECEQEITQMCTSGNSDILVMGTILGSLYLYDMKNIESNPNLAMRYNYSALLLKMVPNY